MSVATPAAMCSVGGVLSWVVDIKGLSKIHGVGKVYLSISLLTPFDGLAMIETNTYVQAYNVLLNILINYILKIY